MENSISYMRDTCHKMASIMKFNTFNFFSVDLYKKYVGTSNKDHEMYYDFKKNKIVIFTGLYHPHKGEWLDENKYIIDEDNEYYNSSIVIIYTKMLERFHEYCKDKFIKEETEKYVKKLLEN